MFLRDACLCVLEGTHMELPSILYQISLTRVGSISRKLSLAMTVVHHTRLL